MSDIENSERFVLFPIKYNEIWKMYKTRRLKIYRIMLQFLEG